MASTRLILVGGFLGAGKTTLLAQAAARLARQGHRIGLVANDQAADLVDTELLRETGSQVEEVAGGCFCCRFPDMITAMERLVRDSQVDVLIGEPVGSCTDLSATVLQPLKELHRERFALAPFSVLVDGHQVRVLARLREKAADARFPDNVLYIYEKQLEEADVIVLNKTDLLSPAELGELQGMLAERFPRTPIMTMSAANGDGVDAWLDYLHDGHAVGGKIVAVDYDAYAAGEAALGWLNASAKVRAEQDVDWSAFATRLLEGMRGALRSLAAEIAHLKLYLTTADGHVVGNITSNDGPLVVRGHIATGQCAAVLLLNARVHGEPDLLATIAEKAMQAAAADGQMDVTLTAMRAFYPGRPQPTYRYREVV
jgi:G3E family GTPase